MESNQQKRFYAECTKFLTGKKVPVVATLEELSGSTYWRKLDPPQDRLVYKILGEKQQNGRTIYCLGASTTLKIDDDTRISARHLPAEPTTWEIMLVELKHDVY